MKLPFYVSLATALTFGHGILFAEMTEATESEVLDIVEENTNDEAIPAEEIISAEEVIAEEPVAEEPIAEEPVAEEPVAEEPSPTEEQTPDTSKETPLDFGKLEGSGITPSETTKVAEVQVMKEQDSIVLLQMIDRIYFGIITAETQSDLTRINDLLNHTKETYAKYNNPEVSHALETLGSLLKVESEVWTSLNLSQPAESINIDPILKSSPVVVENGIGFYGLLVLQKRDNAVKRAPQNIISFCDEQIKLFEGANKRFFAEARSLNKQLKETYAIAEGKSAVDNWAKELGEYRQLIVKRILVGDKIPLLTWWNNKVAKQTTPDYVAGYRLWVNAVNNFNGEKICETEKDRVTLLYGNAQKLHNLSKVIECPKDRSELAYMAADLMQRAMKTWTRDGTVLTRRGVKEISKASVILWNAYAECVAEPSDELLLCCLEGCFNAGDFSRSIILSEQLAPRMGDNKEFWYQYAHMLCLVNRAKDSLDVFKVIAEKSEWIDFGKIQTSSNYAIAWKEFPQEMSKMFLPRVKIDYDRRMVGENQIKITNKSSFPVTNFAVSFLVEGRLLGDFRIQIPVLQAGESVSYDAPMTLRELRTKTEIKWNCDQVKNHQDLIK